MKMDGMCQEKRVIDDDPDRGIGTKIIDIPLGTIGVRIIT